MTERGARQDDFAYESGERCTLGRDSAEELAPGTVVAGKYRVKAVLGRGGFAVVYDAEQLRLGRDVALKVLHRTDGMPQVLIERFLREVRIAALVRHPSVLEVYDAGVHEDGSPFLAMEKITGFTLHQQLSSRGKLTVDEARQLSLQLLSALVAIGERSIVHRDIKPENLMLSITSAGEVQLKLLDFGIALVHEASAASFAARLTQHGALVGTPHYMAPEQLRCELTDARADLYAAGVVMYQLLTGVMPYDGADLSSLTLNVLNGKARALRALCPECPASLARVIERALEREPAQRFADARSMLSALQAAGPGTSARREAIERARAVAGRLKRTALRPHELLVAAATVLLLALGTGPAGVAEALRARFTGFTPHDERTLRAGEATGSVTPSPVAREPESAEHPLRAAPASETTGSSEPTPSIEPEALVARATSAHGREPTPRVRASSAEAESANTLRARALAKKGLTLYLHAELDAAYAVYRKASLLAPNEPAVFRGLGLAASRLGRAYEARRAFTRYLELSPSAPDARLIRARLAGLISEEATRGLGGGPS